MGKTWFTALGALLAIAVLTAIPSCRPVYLGDDDDDDDASDDDVSDDDDDASDDDASDDDSSPGDNDGDGWTVAEGDCNDNNASVHPGATEIPCNGVDDDCAGGDNDEGLSATFSTGAAEVGGVSIAYDEQDDVLKMAINWSSGGNTTEGWHMGYRKYDQALDETADVDTTPAGGWLSSASMKLVLDTSGSPTIVTYKYSDTLALLYPSNAAETSWSSVDWLEDMAYVSALDACTPDGAGADDFHVAAVVNDTLYYIYPDGQDYFYNTHTDPNMQDVVIACESSTVAAMVYSTYDSLQRLEFDSSGGGFSSPQQVYSQGGKIVGATGHGGDPLVLYHHHDLSDGDPKVLRSWYSGNSWVQTSQFTDLSVNYSTWWGGAAHSDNDLGHFTYVLDGTHYYIQDDYGDGQYGSIHFWSDASEEWRYSDVTTDDLDRVWYVYGNDDEFTVRLRCT